MQNLAVRTTISESVLNGEGICLWQHPCKEELMCQHSLVQRMEKLLFFLARNTNLKPDTTVYNDLIDCHTNSAVLVEKVLSNGQTRCYFVFKWDECLFKNE